MRNRAKCKLCNSIIESFHATDLVLCACGAIQVDGGDAMRCAANDWGNFIRVDDEGHEILVTVKENADLSVEFHKTKPSKKECLDMLEEMIKSYERLPRHVMDSAVTHSDLLSVLLLLSSILRSD